MLNALNLVNPRSNFSRKLADDCSAAQKERAAIQGTLVHLRDLLKTMGAYCIAQDLPMRAIGQQSRISTSDDNLRAIGNQSDHPQSYSQSLRDMMRCKEAICGQWSGKRNRINRWILHCLYSDDAQARLHRSMMGDPSIEDQDWGRQVLDNWYIDDAAMGDELQQSLSVGAVGSHYLEFTVRQILILIPRDPQRMKSSIL